MKPLRPAVMCVLLLSLLASGALAGPNAEAPAGAGAAPQAAFGPQAMGAMADAVTMFFRPQNLDPHPVDLTRIVNVLQTVGREGGPTRAEVQPVIDRIRLAADHFDGFDPLEAGPTPGLASSVQLELLAGPLRAWLSDGQKDRILKKQAEYGVKLSSADRAKLRTKMMAMADALASGAVLGRTPAATVDAGGADASAEKSALWREHGHLSASNANRQVDGHDLFGDAAEVLDRPGARIVEAPAPAGGFLRRLLEKAGLAAYLSGHVTSQGIEAARSVLQAPTGVDRFAQRLDDDYFNAHGFYPELPVARGRAGNAFSEPIAPAAPVVLKQAEELAGAKAAPSRDKEFADYVQRLDQDYYDQHGYYPGEQLARSFPQRVRDVLIHYSPILAIALLGGLLAAPHGLVILVLASRLGAGAAVVFLARRLRRKAFFDEKFKRPWLAMALSIPVEFLGWGALISTLAVVAGLLPR